MFCKYCGKNLSDESLKFCTNCGKQLQDTVKENIKRNDTTEDYIGAMAYKIKDIHLRKETNSAIKLIKDAILKPNNAILHFKNNLSPKATGLIYILCTIIMSLSTVFLINFIKDKSVSIMLFGNYGSISLDKKISFKNSLDLLLPNLKVFMWIFTTIVIAYFLLISLSYLIFTLIFKKPLTYLDYMKGNGVAIIFHTIITLLLSFTIVLGFSYEFILLFYLIFAVFLFSIVYECTATLVNDRNKTIYLFPITILLSKVVALYTLFNLASTHFMSLNYLDKTLNIFNI
ncbi:zinc ribbon domain-containing protein, partial [Clostridium tarantellae]